MKVRVSNLAAGVFVVGLLAFFGCSGGENGEGGCGQQQAQNKLTCGQGTVQQGNTCVPAR